jgi:hypothetical protein
MSADRIIERSVLVSRSLDILVTAVVALNPPYVGDSDPVKHASADIPYILESNPHPNLIRTFPSTAPCLQADGLNNIGCLVCLFRPPLWSSGQSSWLQIRRPGFDSRALQKKVMGLERGPLSLVSTTEELLDRKVAAPV